METSYRANEKADEYEITLKGSREAAKAALRALHEDGIIDCDHEFTRQESVDDTRWLAPNGLHERSNKDVTRCEICGAWYEPHTEKWNHE